MGPLDWIVLAQQGGIMTWPDFKFIYKQEPPDWEKKKTKPTLRFPYIHLFGLSALECNIFSQCYWIIFCIILNVFFVWFFPQSWTHNISKEKEFLRKLVKANVITDLTNGIWVYTHPQSPSAFPKGLLNRKQGKQSTLLERTIRIQVALMLSGLSYERRIFLNITGDFL